MNTLSNMDRMNLSNVKVLRRVREQLKLTKVEPARKLKVSVKTIDRIENGEGPITESKINEVLSSLGIRVEEFLKVKKCRGSFRKKRERLVP